MASPRHNPFCARCGITQLLHAYPETSCPKYIAKGSKEARELEATKAEVGAPVDSGLLDRVLMAGALEHLQARNEAAKEFLQTGLRLASEGRRTAAMRNFGAALRALGNLGAA